MLRSRRPLVLLLALSFSACSRQEAPILPEPARPVVIETPAPAPQAPQGGPTSPDQGMPKSVSGVLPPGAADKVLPVGSPPLIKLLEPGAEPRADLSYGLAKGTSQKMVMAMDMVMALKMKGQAMPKATIPRISMIFDTAATDKSAGGEFKIDSRLTNLSVQPNGGSEEQMARALQPQLDGMKGLGMGYWISPKGRVRDVKLDLPAGMPASAQQLLGGMSQSFESMVTPLPAEPVGVGARWQVVSRLASSGADLLQSAIYTLKARTGNKATLDVNLIQLAASDSIHGPTMPQGMSAKVTSFSSGGSGTSELDVKSVAPESATMALKTAMDISVVGAGVGAGDESSVETTTTVHVSRP